MGLGSMFFGDPERKRRERRQADLDTNYYKRQKIYNQAKETERERIAKLRGTQDAQAIANRKPFYKKVVGLAANIGKDLVKGSGKVNPDALFSWGNPQPKRRKKRRKKK